MTNRKGIPAAAFMAGAFSSAGRTPAEPAVKAQPKILVVERWNGRGWVNQWLEWNGTEYKEIN